MENRDCFWKKYLWREGLNCKKTRMIEQWCLYEEGTRRSQREVLVYKAKGIHVNIAHSSSQLEIISLKHVWSLKIILLESVYYLLFLQNKDTVETTNGEVKTGPLFAQLCNFCLYIFSEIVRCHFKSGYETQPRQLSNSLARDWSGTQSNSITRLFQLWCISSKCRPYREGIHYHESLPFWCRVLFPWLWQVRIFNTSLLKVIVSCKLVTNWELKKINYEHLIQNLDFW